MATILYNDRINCYRDMKALDAEIDNSPTKAKVTKLAELRIRNLQAFDELKSLNDNGKFLFKHPLIIHHSLRRQLEQMLQDKPDEFMDEYANCRDNIKRYNSYLNSNKRTVNQKKKDRENLNKHQERATVFKEVLSCKK